MNENYYLWTISVHNELVNIENGDILDTMHYSKLVTTYVAGFRMALEALVLSTIRWKGK